MKLFCLIILAVFAISCSPTGVIKQVKEEPKDPAAVEEVKKEDPAKEEAKSEEKAGEEAAEEALKTSPPESKE